jgi:hypothetical protein
VEEIAVTDSPPPLPPPSSDHPGVVVLGEPAAAEPPPPRSRTGRTRQIAAALSGLAAALLVAGTLLPYQFVAATSGDPMLAQRVETTSWTVTVTRSSTGIDFKDSSHPPYYGVPVLVVAAALAVAVVLLLRGAGSAKTVVVAAAAATATLLAMLATAIASTLSAFTQSFGGVPEISAGTGNGFWVLLAGGVAAVAAAVFACIRSSPQEADTDRTEDTDDLDTPPLGFPAPVVHE